MINYAEKIFTRQYSSDGKKLYATFHPEVIIEREEYATTGRYLVVLLHAEKGLQAFYLNRNNDSGAFEINEDDPAVVEEELLEWCSNQIIAQQGNKTKVPQEV